MRVATVVGARPQFIKCAPLSRELRKGHEEVLIHTGQHYDHQMSGVFFDELGIPRPDHDLGVGSASPGKQTGEMLSRIEEVLVEERPDVVVVFGDTNSTLAGSLAASKAGLPVAHVEAGLRSRDRSMPEEINRILTDHVSDLLFCPTEQAAVNLQEEGIRQGVHMVGDVMVDALEPFRQKIVRPDGRGRDEDAYVLATVHRAGNTDDRSKMMEILKGLAGSPRKVVFPMHPRTRDRLTKYGLLDDLPSNVEVIEPVGYVEMLDLIGRARMVATDSGGVQKEAYLLGTPCITLRENSEWMETVEAGWNILVGANGDRISQALQEFRPVSAHRELFGDGRACQRIVAVLEDLNARTA